MLSRFFSFLKDLFFSSRNSSSRVFLKNKPGKKITKKKQSSRKKKPSRNKNFSKGSGLVRKSRPKQKKNTGSPNKKVKKATSKTLFSPSPKKKTKHKPIGIITHYFDKISVGIIKLNAPLKLHQKIYIKTSDGGCTQEVNSLQLNHKNIISARKGDEVGLKVIRKVKPGNEVYLIE